jgi:hypothetical protein
MKIAGEAKTGRLRFGKFVCLFSARENERKEAVAAKEAARAEYLAVSAACEKQFPNCTLTNFSGNWKFSFYRSTHSKWVIKVDYTVSTKIETMVVFESLKATYLPLVHDLLAIEQIMNDKGWCSQLEIRWREDGTIAAMAAGDSWELDLQDLTGSFNRLMTQALPAYWGEIGALQKEFQKNPLLTLTPTTFGVKVYNPIEEHPWYEHSRWRHLGVAAAKTYLEKWHAQGEAVCAEVDRLLRGATPQMALGWEGRAVGETKGLAHMPSASGKVFLEGNELKTSSGIVAQMVYFEALRRGLRTPLRRQIETARLQGLRLRVKEVNYGSEKYESAMGKNKADHHHTMTYQIGGAEFSVKFWEAYDVYEEPEPGIYEFAKSINA